MKIVKTSDRYFCVSRNGYIIKFSEIPVDYAYQSYDSKDIDRMSYGFEELDTLLEYIEVSKFRYGITGAFLAPSYHTVHDIIRPEDLIVIYPEHFI